MNNEEIGSRQDALKLELIIRESCGAKSAAIKREVKKPLRNPAHKRRRKARQLDKIGTCFESLAKPD
jgi:hypothetical protein